MTQVSGLENRDMKHIFAKVFLIFNLIMSDMHYYSLSIVVNVSLIEFNQFVSLIQLICVVTRKERKNSINSASSINSGLRGLNLLN